LELARTQPAFSFSVVCRVHALGADGDGAPLVFHRGRFTGLSGA
jgi:hypothetical protein